MQDPRQPSWASNDTPPPPAYGYPPQHTQPGYPGPGQPTYGGSPHYPLPPQQPNNERNKIVAIGCLGSIALIVLIAVVGALLGTGGDSDKPAAQASASPAAAGPTGDSKPSAQPKKKTKPPANPVKITARKTRFTPSVLHDGTPHTSVKVTIVNNSSKTISINPLYFAITDTRGTKHAQALAADDQQIETTKLAPGENITGVITGKGAFTPKYVTYTEMWADPIRVTVT